MSVLFLIQQQQQEQQQQLQQLQLLQQLLQQQQLQQLQQQLQQQQQQLQQQPLKQQEIDEGVSIPCYMTVEKVSFDLIRIRNWFHRRKRLGNFFQ